MINSEAYDAIVVGSGPGGATVTRELSKAGKKIALVDWGRHKPLKGNMIQAVLSIGIPGKSLLFTPDFAAVFRGIISGGSSVFYYGTAFEPPIELFKKYGVDISKEVMEVGKELPTQPLDDSLVGPMAMKIMHSARELGYDWKKLPKFIYQDKCKTECWRCSYGCPHGAKWSGRLFVEQSLENGADLIPGTRVEKVLIENGKVVGVEIKKNGRKSRIEAPLVVISAGGIGSPVILNNSGIEGTGKDFFFDPLIAVMGTTDRIPGGGREIPMATGIHMEEEGYLMTDMTMTGTLFRAFNVGALKPQRLFSHDRTLTIMVKARDDLGGSLTRRGGVKKRISQEDKNKLNKGFERAREILKKAGARDIYRSMYLAAHPGGTVKIGEVVDSNLQTKTENLYVCDCSVIPEAWGLPPTFSLVALGKRLARHILDKN
ncbi:GMC family oxidoreductase [bacterium]|nr:GMC family oxidoreductase [bacterium]